MAGILILGETTGNDLQSATGELLAAGRNLADSLGEEVAIALLGNSPNGLHRKVISQGADKVYLVQNSLLSTPHTDTYLEAFEKVCRQTEPSVVLIARTPTGRDVGPRIAFKLGVGVAQDCVEIAIDSVSRRVVATRPVYGGNALAKVTFPQTNPQVVVLRTKIYEPLEPNSARTGEAIPFQVDLTPPIIKTIETVKRESKGVRLEDATIVISGGRGLGGPEPFQMLEDLASLLNGAVGASRAVCDAGWIDHDCQIGLTGKTITPDLYITVCISGASQHMAGCSGAKHIVAINKDTEANIFKAASFGVLGDWKKILPSFIETVRELVKS